MNMKPEIPTQIKNNILVEKKRDQIINSAAELFYKKGYDKTTIREICRSSGVTVGNLYDYVQKKEDILYLVHDHMVRNIYSFLFDYQEKGQGCRPQDLEGILRNALNKAFEYQEAILLLYRETASLPKPLRKRILEHEMDFIKRLQGILDIGVRKGNFKIKNTDVIANLIVFLMAFVALRRWNLKKYDRSELIDIMIDFILKRLSS